MKFFWLELYGIVVATLAACFMVMGIVWLFLLVPLVPALIALGVFIGFIIGLALEIHSIYGSFKAWFQKLPKWLKRIIGL